MLVGLLVLGLSACTDFNKVMKLTSADDKYKAALKYYQKGDWYRAGVLFEEVIPRLKGGSEMVDRQARASCRQRQGLALGAGRTWQEVLLSRVEDG